MAVQDYEKVWTNYAKRHKEQRPDAQLGDEWGSVEHSQKLFQKYVAPRLTPQAVVAELGVGGGKHSSMLAEHAARLYGVDISSEMLALTAERLKGSSCTFVPVKTDGKSVALEDGSIDLFVSFDSMVHIFPNDLYRYIEEMKRFLKPGAMAIFEFADWDATGMVQKFLNDYEVYRKAGKLSPGAFGFISRSAICKLAEHAGFRVVTPPEQASDRTSVIVLQK